MPSGESSNAEITQFEAIASRLDNCRSRINNVTSAVEKSVNILAGSEPGPIEEKVTINDSAGDSVISGLLRLLTELEAQVFSLEHEQGRLTKIFF